MYPPPTLCFEIGVAILIGLVFLWTRVEYGLFLYALALGFPDVAFPLGTTINIRLDDVLILLFLARTFLWVPAAASKGQKKILAWQTLFLAACLFSAAVESAKGTPPEGYVTAKMAGCAVIVLVLPRLVQSERRLQFFIAGLMCAGISLAIQVFMHLGASSSNDFVNFQEMKDAATFTTWNPNTIGQAAVLLVFGAGLGGIIFSKTRASKILWPCLALGFALVPALVFVRGTTIGIAAGFLLFLCLARRLSEFGLVHTQDVCNPDSAFVPPQLEDAAHAQNVTTGEGFSHRFERWGMALQAIQTAPFLGQGFGQEM